MGGIDIALNAVSFPYAQGTLLGGLAVEEVMHPIDSFLRTNLITAKAHGAAHDRAPGRR